MYAHFVMSTSVKQMHKNKCIALNEIYVTMATKLLSSQRFNKKHSKLDIFKSNYLLTAKVYINDTYSA